MSSFVPLAAIGAENIKKHIVLVSDFLEKSFLTLPSEKREASQFLLTLLQNKELNLKNHSIANAIFLLLIPYGLTSIPFVEDGRLRECLAKASHIRSDALKTWLPQKEGVESEKASYAISVLYDSAKELLPSYTYEIDPVLQLLAGSLDKES